jgi:hypothetical protein
LNRSDIFYWPGTREEFCKLYDFTKKDIHDILPSARFGGPTTGTRNPQGKAAIFSQGFSGELPSGHKPRRRQKTFAPPSAESLVDQVRVLVKIAKDSGYGHLECVLSEADPDGWAAGGRFDNPALDFRNTQYYASYVASSHNQIFDLALSLYMDIGPLAWRSCSRENVASKVRAVYMESSGSAQIDGWATLTGDRSLEMRTATRMPGQAGLSAGRHIQHVIYRRGDPGFVKSVLPVIRDFNSKNGTSIKPADTERLASCWNYALNCAHSLPDYISYGGEFYLANFSTTWEAGGMLMASPQKIGCPS